MTECLFILSEKDDGENSKAKYTCYSRLLGLYFLSNKKKIQWAINDAKVKRTIEECYHLPTLYKELGIKDFQELDITYCNKIEVVS